jgi:carboxyl-terminal processing protease
MKKRLTYGALLAALLAYLLVGSRVYQLRAASDKDDVYQQLELFARVLHRIRADYVDADKVSYKELVHGALKGMLASLDPHSEFMDITKYEELRQDTEGIYGGVGLQVGVRDGELTVIAPMEDSPAYEAGILAGDRIVQIEGKGTDKFTQGDAVKRLRGEPGSKVTLSIARESCSTPHEFTLTRQDIRVYTAKDLENHRDFKLGPDKIGYVRLTQFGEKTADELEEALKKLEAQGMQSLVLDLRGNPGGLLDQAILVCEKFLEKGQPIVSTEARSPANEIHKAASGRGKHRKQPIAVLVNGGSASAAEIVSGCLQDLKRATVIGEQSFGKGSVQSILPLTDGTALRLTTAKYYTPSHKVIHEKGITPDIVVPMNADEEIAIQLRRLPGGKENLEDALKVFDGERQERLRVLAEAGRDSQLERAFEVLKGPGGQLTKRLPEDNKPAEPLVQ